jgi:hypothetical protein
MHHVNGATDRRRTIRSVVNANQHRTQGPNLMHANGLRTPALLETDRVSLADLASRTRPRGRLGRPRGRLGVVGTGAALVVLACSSPARIPAVSGATATASIQPSSATTSSAAVTVPLCRAVDLDGRIVRWEATAGGRAATVELENTGAGSCALPHDPRPALLDADDVPLIVGAVGQWTGSISAGDVLHSTVEVRNYCGQDGRDPVRIFVEATFADGRDAVTFVPATGGPGGVPPCSDANGTNPDITMHEWEQGLAPAG